jgi:single-strand DNA-binding protein
MLKFSAIGHLGQDARQGTGGSQPVVNFSLGVKTGFGEKKRDFWLDCALWGARGEKLAEYLKKGQQVYVEGEGGFRTYTDNRDGQQKIVLTCRVSEVELLGSKPANGTGVGHGGDRYQGDPGPQDSGAYGAARSAAAKPAHDQLDDEIPF